MYCCKLLILTNWYALTAAHLTSQGVAEADKDKLVDLVDKLINYLKDWRVVATQLWPVRAALLLYTLQLSVVSQRFQTAKFCVAAHDSAALSTADSVRSVRTARSVDNMCLQPAEQCCSVLA
jgi:hypothetical protein